MSFDFFFFLITQLSCLFHVPTMHRATNVKLTLMLIHVPPFLIFYQMHVLRCQNTKLKLKNY